MDNQSDISDEYTEEPQVTDKPRKRVVNKSKWKKNILKESKYALKVQKKASLSCSHDDNSCSAAKLCDGDIAKFNEAFWKNKDAISQKKFLFNYIDVKKPKRHRPGQRHSQRSEKTKTILYRVQTKFGPYRVCRNSFLSILNIGRRKVENAAREKLEFFFAQPETRGGARQRNSMVEMRGKIIAHIKRFKCRSKHYGRKNAPKRKYLPSELNITRMWKMLCEEDAAAKELCKYDNYCKIFSTKFNLGFGSVKQDTCNDCEAYNNKYKATNDIAVKKTLIGERMVHKFRAKKFFELLNKTLPGCLNLNFDLMQNQPLPKSQINQAYYSRQLWYYILGIIIHRETKELNPETVHFYRWLETDGGRGTAEISSCLWDFFVKILRPICVAEGIKCLRVFTDSCGGQNRNYCLLSLFATIASQFDLKVEWYFPIRGHSYMPADRAFGLIETQLLEKSTILVPEAYDKIASQFGTVHVYGKDFPWLNWKDLSNTSIAVKKPFKISKAKQMSIHPKSGAIGIREIYAEPICQFKLLKRGKSFRDMILSLSELDSESHVSDAKKNDVLVLLRTMGHVPEEIPFYRTVFQLQPKDAVNDESSDCSSIDTEGDSDDD